LKRQFNLDDEYLQDLKSEIIEVRQVAVEQDGGMLVWTSNASSFERDARRVADEENRFQAMLRAVIWTLQHERRTSYRELKRVLGLDGALLREIRAELSFKRLARDEDGTGLVWTGVAQPVAQPSVDGPNHPGTAGPTLTQSPAKPTSSLVAETLTPSNEPTASPEAIFSGALQNEPAVTPRPAPGAPDAERRQLTVMFCDLADSTKLSQKLDPEDWREVVQAYQTTAAEIIHHYEGHMAQYLGDGLLVYFGWPVAHEDDAQRSLHAGLDLVEAITTTLNPRLEQEKGVQLTVRLGVHTGPVVVGEMGGGGRHENLATGDTVNIASRLEGLAAPNTVVTSRVTAHLLRDAFVLEALGPQELKGVAEPMQVFRVDRRREVDAEEAGTGGFEVLVGRDEEIGLLQRRWGQSKEGLGQVVLISGEAGIGKSSLVEGLRHHVRREGFTRITFRCSEYVQHSPLHPVIEHVQRVMGWQREDTAETRLAKLERALEPSSLPHEEAIPLVAALLSLSLPESRYPALALLPQQQRQQTQDVLVAWMLEEAERQPVLAVWEDLHWADPSTLELLGLFIDQVPTVSMLHVLVFRPTFVPPWPIQSYMTPLTLNRLERPQVKAMVNRLTGGKALPAEVVEHIVAKTDGVPLYVEELTKMLLESTFLQEDAGQYTLTGPLEDAAIPATLQDSLMARLDRLPSVREVAQLGAVLGREFAYEMLQSLSTAEEPTLQEGLRQLVNSELLYHRGRPPRATYTFRHALIRDTAYLSLLRRTRQHYHKQVAQLLEGRFPEVVETQPELVAYHYTEAGLTAPAIDYWQRAGQRASERSAYQEAISHLTTGLTLLHAQPETVARHQQELPLQTALGAASLMVKGHTATEVEAAYTRARVLCRQLGDTQDMLPVLFGLWRFYVMRADYAMARQLGEELLGLAERGDESPLRVIPHYAVGFTYFCLGELLSARRHLEEGIAHYDPAQRRHPVFWAGQDPGVACRVYAACTLWLLGYPDQALACAHDGLGLATELAHPFSDAFALVFVSVVERFRRDRQDVYDHAVAAVTLSSEQGFPSWLALGTFLRGWALTGLGQREEGMIQIRQGLAGWRALGTELFVPYFLTHLAEEYGALNRVDEGLDALKEGWEAMERTGEHWWEAEMHRLKGDLLSRQSTSDVVQATDSFRQALEVARNQQAKSLELRAATSLARLWRSQGKGQEAYDLLAPLYGWFTEGFDTADLKDAKALLEELGG
jgi:class 3 adenylate cyclase/predicted ATPase